MAASVRRRSLGEGIALEDPLMPPFTMPHVLLAILVLCSPSTHILLELLLQVVGLPRGLASASIWRLYSVDAPLVDGVIKSYAGWCFHIFCHSPTRLPPLVQRWMVVGGARMCYKRCYHQLQGGSSYPVSPGLRTFYHF